MSELKNKSQTIRRMIEKECQRDSLVDLCEYWGVTCDEFYAFLDDACRSQPDNEPLTLDELREELERLEELATATNGDVEETYTNGYRWGHRNGQIELLRRILNIGDGTCESECHKPERSEG